MRSEAPNTEGADLLLAFHKPYGVLSRFGGGEEGHRTLAEFGFPPAVYPLGRLDADSEGLLLLSDEKALNAELLHPDRGHVRAYHVQVEGVPSADVLACLEAGVVVQGRRTRPCRARKLEPAPVFAPRVPPIRVRKSIPDAWIEIELTEGRNRQVRRMTAAAGLPTLRLVRVRIGRFALADLAPGAWRELGAAERRAALGADPQSASRSRARRPA